MPNCSRRSRATKASVRLKAEVLRQVDHDRFVAQNASLTTSRLGIPTYEFKSGNLTLEDHQVPAVNIFGQPEINPQTGEPITEHEQLVTGRNNVITVEGIPSSTGRGSPPT